MSDDYQAMHLERAADRAVRRRYRTVWYRTKRAAVIGTVYITAAGVVSLHPFGWFKPADCGAQTSAAVDAQPAVVKVATDQGRMLRRLAGPPPTPAQTNKVATDAADAVVVTVLAFLASAKDKPTPAKVTAYNTAHARTAAAKQAREVAACTPKCPTDGAPGPVTVAHTPGLAGEPAAIAARITAVGRSMGFPDEGIVIALAAARQESGLRNLNYGDRDSLGVFQQRASWGTAAQRTNPEWAARAFYQALGRVPGWQSMTVTAAAQAVQRSAYPGAYADDESVARAVLSGQPAASCAGAGASTYKTGAGTAWGGYQNGRIPAGALVHPRWAPAHLMRADAAAAFDQLSAAYKARFGRGLGVTDSYRSYAAQVSTKAAKGGLAARPGTSNHGWGLAIDAVTGTYSDARYLWLRANAPQFGWDNPGWARPGGSKHEPWHWEFNPTGART